MGTLLEWAVGLAAAVAAIGALALGVCWRCPGCPHDDLEAAV